MYTIITRDTNHKIVKAVVTDNIETNTDAYTEIACHNNKDEAARYLSSKHVTNPVWDIENANYLLHGVQAHQLHTTEMTIPYATKEEVFAILADIRQCQMEYEDAVQDTETKFIDSDNGVIIDIRTLRGNYADSHDEFDLTDKNGNHIPMTWEEIMDTIR